MIFLKFRPPSRRGGMSPAGCPRGRIPRTGIIALYSLIARPTACRRGHVPRKRCPLCHVPRAAGRRCLIPRTGVIALPSLLRGQPKCHSEPPRMRRVEESTKAAAKWLQCNPTHVLIRKLYCNHTGSFDFVPRYSLGTSLRMTGWRNVADLNL